MDAKSDHNMTTHLKVTDMEGYCILKQLETKSLRKVIQPNTNTKHMTIQMNDVDSFL